MYSSSMRLSTIAREASLRDLLKTTETLSQASLTLESQLVQAPDTGRHLFIQLVNNSSRTLWLYLSRLVTRVEAKQVRHALPVTWDRPIRLQSSPELESVQATARIAQRKDA